MMVLVPLMKTLLLTLFLINKTLSGTVSTTETSGTDNLIGTGYDTSEVRIGDVLDIPSGIGNRIVNTISLILL